MANKQQIVCDYIQENLVQFGRVRHDLISNKVQINDGMSRADGCKMANSTQLNKDERLWFDLDDIDALEVHNDDFRAQENEEQLLAVYFDVPSDGNGDEVDIRIVRGTRREYSLWTLGRDG